MTPSNICMSSAIWDLHIHSNQCTKPDKELAKLPIEKYVDALLEVFSDYPRLEMISFTDHNRISEKVYREFFERKSNVSLVPGIEVDTKLTEDGESKHLVVYFDCANDEERLSNLCAGVNAIMDEHSIGPDNPIFIHSLFDELLDLKFKFIVSPHAFKQKKRGIDWDWHVDGVPSPNIDKYTDQFFAFWEASGASQVAKAIEYLEMMDREERESIVSFSDSKEFRKLRKYLDSPPQYFSALPNFIGMQMVGSEATRITREPIEVDETKRGQYLGSICLARQKIALSPRLNAIIGGRGSGKSALLDSLALALNESKCRESLGDESRIEFLETIVPAVRCLSGQEPPVSAFRFDYFNQSYVASLFQAKGEAFNRQLESYFGSAFDPIDEIDVESIKSANALRFNEFVNSATSEESDNLVDFVGRFGIDRDEKLSLKVPKAPSASSVKPYASLDYELLRSKVEKAFDKDIPELLRSDTNVSEAFLAYEKAVIEAAHQKRIGYLEGDYLLRSLDEKLKAKKSELSEAAKNRQDAIDSFKKAFYYEAKDAKYRTCLVKAYIKVQKEIALHHENKGYADGENKKAFCFKRELDIQAPIDYLIESINEFFLAEVGAGEKCTIKNLLTFVDAFRFGDRRYKAGKDAEGLEKKLKQFALSYSETSSVWYRSSTVKEYENIASKSPGTRTNILLEYIVHRNTNVPLLIDQPEDNVDNQTIYGQIRDWFISLKEKRQVIVVTHDANIVVNADAENIVIASQLADGSFRYESGALEYQDMLEQASRILDGGVEAVRRRLMKYGG